MEVLKDLFDPSGGIEGHELKVRFSPISPSVKDDGRGGMIEEL
jgi:hypothetical protein